MASSTSTPTPTSRPARLAERASLVLLVAGVAAYGAAYLAMRRLEQGAPVGPPGAKVLFAGLGAHAQYSRWAQGGLALVALGLLVAVGASYWTLRAKRAAHTER